MPSNFFFDAASDDELEQLDREGVSSGEEDKAEDRKGQAEAGADDEDEDEKTKQEADVQSPRDVASYSRSVEENVSDVEPEKQEEYLLEDEDVAAKPFFSTVDEVSFHADSFMELNLSRPLLRACETLGYKKPTPIQAACIPLALTGRDLCAITGSGKTAAFALPTLERLLFRPKRGFATRVLILTPARGIHSMIQKLAQFTDIKCGLIVGGLSIRQALEQMAVLRSMPDIVVATPRRMIDHLRNSIMCVDLNDIAVLILDEADRLLQKGFATEIQELVHLCPKRKQTMLFSATMTEEVNELVKLSLNKPLRLSADPSDRRPPGLTEEAIIESDAASESRINSPSPTPPGLTEEAIYKSDAASDSRINIPSPRPRGSTEEAIYISDTASESRSFIYFLLSIAIFESGK